MTVKGWTSADLRYCPQTHTTTTPDGRDVPHVTKVLAETGVATDFEQVMLLSRRLRDHVEDRRLLGSVVHQDCHAFDDGDLVWDTVDPRVAPYVRAWQICRRNLGLEPVVRERQVYHPADHYTGFLDGIFKQAYRKVLVDLKVGSADAAACDLQTAAYAAAYLAEHPKEVIHSRFAIELKPEREVPYAVVPYGDHWREDYRKFQACLVVYREQVRRRRVTLCA